MSFRNISAWAIRNPIAPIVLFIALTLAGVLSFIQMQVNNNPDISFPAAQITVVQPGAAPTELETQVAQKVEAAIRGVNGVDAISSWITEGSSNTSVLFAIGTPVDRAINDVRDAIANIRGDLPDGILEPQIQRADIDGGPIAYYSAEAVDMTLEELSWYVDNHVAKRLLSVPGMASVQRSGGVSREIRVILDPVRMQAQGITAAQVNQELRSINLNAAGGRAEIAGSEQSVRVLGNASSAFVLGDTMISVGGRSIKLSDIATVRDLYAEQRSISKMNGRQVLSFSMAKAKGSSDVTVYDEGVAMLRKLEQENSKVKFTQLYTSVDYTRDQYHSAINAMWEGAVLAVFVVFLFLRDWRATAISAIAIPLSAIPAFWFMNLMGFTLNSISLLALSLVAGVLVDDAIVEIENIVRHMRMGKTAYQASIDAADEIGLAVLATTMAIVAVFLPVGLMPGLTGQFFKQFGLTVVVAVLISLAVARLITPMAAAYFLKSHGPANHGDNWMMRKYVAMLDWSLDTRKALAFKAKHAGRKRWLAWTLDHRFWIVGMGFVSFLLTIVAFSQLQFVFQPTINTDYSQVRIEMVPGSTLKQTENVVDEVSTLLRTAPEVAAAFGEVNVGEANIYITLNKARARTSIEFERDMATKLRTVADARVTFQSQGGGLGRDVTLMLAGSDPVLVTATANKIVEEMKTLPQLRAPRINGDIPRPEITIKPRLSVAADLGVSTAALSQTIRIATQGEIDQNAAKFSLSDRQIPIRVMLDQSARTSLATIENLPVPTASGGTVPLKVVADIGFGAGPSILRRYNQNRRVAIGADYAPGVVTASKEIDALPTMKAMTDGKLSGVERVAFGDDKLVKELVFNFIVAVVSGTLLVFAVLVLLYRRIMPPFVNMGSLALAPLGGAVALLITGNPISMPVMIGLLMLLGIVAKNSILLVDFALEEMGKGVDKRVAILDSGHKRAQPIVMTTVAMVAGMLPIALALSGDGSWRAPMGIVVIGGLILSTVLTLVIVPATFSLAVGFENRIAPWLRRKLTNGGGEMPATQPAE
jgi:multidrug efflux pump subunit AcrB